MGPKWRPIVGSVLAVALLSSCGADSASPAGETTLDHDCVPGSVVGEPLTHPDRRIEDIIEFLTGERQTTDTDPVEETITDPNFGGVWGDFQGGIVVAVLDCSLVDADEIARLAGGAEYLHLIEVPYTYRQVNSFRDTLTRELKALGLDHSVFIHPTLEGRAMEVHVLDVDALPAAFAPQVPRDAYVLVESSTVGTRPAG